MIPVAHDSDGPVMNGEECLHVWQVKLKDGKSLTAERLTSLPCVPGSVESFSLGRRVLAYVHYPIITPTWVEVCWWEQSTATKRLRAWFYIEFEKFVRGSYNFISWSKLNLSRIQFN